jgi:hypothetical protein
LPYAGYFDGTDNAINAAATGLPTGTGQPVSMSAWVNYQGTNTAPYQIAEYGTNSTGRMFGAYVGYGYLTFGGNADDVTTPYLVPTDTWQHIVMTYDGTSIRAYVNGVLVWGPTAPPTPLNLSTAGLNIGGGSSNWFKGLIDDVRFYSTQLTQTQITALYNAGDTSFSVPTPNTVSQTVNTLSNNNGLILPSTLTGYHGTGAGDVKVQFSDGTGSSGHLATYDPNGGLTDGGAPGVGTVTTSGSPVSLNAACFSSSTAITACTSANLQTAIGASVYDVSGAATTAQSNAETYASNASNLSSGTVAAARLPAALANSTSVNGTTIPASATLLTTASTYSGTLTSSQVTTALTYTPANCTAGTSAGNCLTLNGSSLVPAGNLPAATPTAAGIVVKVANVSITVSSGTQGANSCSSATSVTMTGLTTSMVVTPGYSADPSTLTGWGSVGGMTFKAWPDSANTMKWRACNTTPASITYSTATFNVGAN